MKSKKRFNPQAFKEFRESQCLSQEGLARTLAERLGDLSKVSQATINNWEKGNSVPCRDYKEILLEYIWDCEEMDLKVYY